MGFIKALYSLTLVVAVFLGLTLGDARAQTADPAPPPPTTTPAPGLPPELVPQGYSDALVDLADGGANSYNGGLAKNKVALKDTMNFEACVDIKTKAFTKSCAFSCGIPIPLAWVQFDYYEPVALVESVPKPWATLFSDTENFISRAFTKFEKTPFGATEAVQPIRTENGVFPQRYFETHVWGLSIPTRFIMLMYESATLGLTHPRVQGMVASLTYEIGLIVTDAMGLSELTNLGAILRAIKNAVLNYFSGGGYTMYQTIKFIKDTYSFVKSIYDVVTTILSLIQTAIAWVSDPLQMALKHLLKMLVGYCKGEDVSVFGNTIVDGLPDPSIESGDDSDKELKVDNRRCGQGVLDDLTDSLKRGVKKLGKSFGGIAKSMQLGKAFSVFSNFAKNIIKRMNEFTDGWSLNAGTASKDIESTAKTCTNSDWLCEAQGKLGEAGQGTDSPFWGADAPFWTEDGTDTTPDAAGGPVMTGITSASSSVDNRISELGGSCDKGKAVGNWGDKVSSCDSGPLDKFSEALSNVNKVQDYIRAGSVINMLGSMAGSLLPIGLIPSYLSEFDRPSWNKGTPNFVSIVQSAVANMPGACALATASSTFNMNVFPDTIRKDMCIGIWGALYPKVGAVPVEGAHLAAAITNFRAFSLASNWGTLPMKYDPRKSSLRFNVDHPFKGKRCYDIGTISPTWDSQIFDNKSAGSAALDAMTGGATAVIKNIDGALKAASDNPIGFLQDGASSDGYVHTYWKKTRACVNICPTGVKWRKLY